MADEKARQPTNETPKPVNILLSKIHDLPGSVFEPPNEKSLAALTSSIVLKGVQEPVILRQREDGKFQIVSGNRRRKASELAKKAEIPAFVYDMTEKEAKEFRFRDKGEGTPPGKLLFESEIGKKRETPTKEQEKTADAVKVNSVSIEAAQGRSLAAFGDKATLAHEKVNSNKFGFSLSLGNGAKKSDRNGCILKNGVV